MLVFKNGRSTYERFVNQQLAIASRVGSEFFFRNKKKSHQHAYIYLVKPVLGRRVFNRCTMTDR